MTAIAASIEWLVALVTGPLVTGLLTLAVAIVGFRLLSGRSSLRQGAFVLIGSFILIGSSYIAQSLVNVVPREVAVPAPPPPSAEPPRDLPEPPPAPPSERGNPFDPYSGNAPVN
ncbi:MAG: TrbC/VirB2 family protein [Pseudomonadota bacterium]